MKHDKETRDKLVEWVRHGFKNGPKSDLMDKLLAALKEHVDVDQFEDWPAIELYLARACKDVAEALLKED